MSTDATVSSVASTNYWPPLFDYAVPLVLCTVAWYLYSVGVRAVLNSVVAPCPALPRTSQRSQSAPPLVDGSGDGATVAPYRLWQEYAARTVSFTHSLVSSLLCLSAISFMLFQSESHTRTNTTPPISAADEATLLDVAATSLLPSFATWSAQRQAAASSAASSQIIPPSAAPPSAFEFVRPFVTAPSMAEGVWRFWRRHDVHVHPLSSWSLIVSISYFIVDTFLMFFPIPIGIGSQDGEERNDGGENGNGKGHREASSSSTSRRHAPPTGVPPRRFDASRHRGGSTASDSASSTSPRPPTTFSLFYLVHHVISVACLVTPLLVGYGSDETAFVLWVMEASNPLMHGRWMYRRFEQLRWPRCSKRDDDDGATDGRPSEDSSPRPYSERHWSDITWSSDAVYRWITLAWFATFFFLRVVVSPVLQYILIASTAPWHIKTLGAVLLISSLNFFRNACIQERRCCEWDV